jgi:hypothetical protein
MKVKIEMTSIYIFLGMVIVWMESNGILQIFKCFIVVWMWDDD